MLRIQKKLNPKKPADRQGYYYLPENSVECGVLKRCKECALLNRPKCWQGPELITVAEIKKIIAAVAPGNAERQVWLPYRGDQC